ncbi:MAG: GNAT family N-acetyltransferase [Fibrobacteria bacterium]
MKQKYQDAYEFDDDLRRLDYPVLEAWLGASYWSPGIKRAEIEAGAKNSALIAGCYRDGAQVAFLRVASDKVRFAYIMDVYVAEPHRRLGIAENLVRFAMSHPEVREVYQWLLATRDAHSVYLKAGFGPLSNPENMMMLKKEKVR